MQKQNKTKKKLIFLALDKADVNIDFMEKAYAIAISKSELLFLEQKIKQFIKKYPYEYKGYKLLILVAGKLHKVEIASDFINSMIKFTGTDNTSAVPCFSYLESITEEKKYTFFNLERDCKEFDLTTNVSANFLNDIINSLYVDFDGERDPYAQSVSGGEVRYLKNGVSEHIDKLICLIDEYVHNYKSLISDSPLKIPRVDNLKRGFWSVGLEQNGKILSHFHPRGILSGVIYLRLAERQGASLKLGCSPSGLKENKHVKVFKTAPLKLIIFPSYYFHSTTNYKGDETRICISFDYMTSSQAKRHYNG